MLGILGAWFGWQCSCWVLVLIMWKRANDSPFSHETDTPSLTLSTTEGPTSTVAPTNTITPTATYTETPTPTPELRPFIMAGEPETAGSEMIPQQQLGCDWLVITGQVWDWDYPSDRGNYACMGSEQVHD